MKVFLAALVFAAVAAVGTVDGAQQHPAAEFHSSFTTSGARVGDPGNNLMVPG